MRIFIAIFFLASLTILVSGDEIRLHDGVIINGKITAETSSTVMIKTPSGTVIVERSTIASLTKSNSDTTGATSPSSSASPNSKRAAATTGPEFWPPKLDQKFPELTLYNQHGKIVTLSKVARGRPILLEPVGMSCRACQAFSGAHKYGPYKGIEPQANLEAIETSFPRYTEGGSLSNPNIVFVQLILFDMDMKAPAPETVREWAKHFKLAHKPNTHILAGTPKMVSQESFDMIPGFFLIDKKFVLRADATGHQPRHNLWREVLPSVPQVMR